MQPFGVTLRRCSMGRPLQPFLRAACTEGAVQHNAAQCSAVQSSAAQSGAAPRVCELVRDDVLEGAVARQQRRRDCDRVGVFHPWQVTWYSAQYSSQHHIPHGTVSPPPAPIPQHCIPGRHGIPDCTVSPTTAERARGRARTRTNGPPNGKLGGMTLRTTVPHGYGIPTSRSAMPTNVSASWNSHAACQSVPSTLARDSRYP